MATIGPAHLVLLQFIESKHFIFVCDGTLINALGPNANRIRMHLTNYSQFYTLWFVHDPAAGFAGT